MSENTTHIEKQSQSLQSTKQTQTANEQHNSSLPTTNEQQSQSLQSTKQTQQHSQSLRGTKQTQTANQKSSSSLRGTKQSQGLVPQLRFNEFEGDWNKYLLGNISEKVGSGSTPSGGNQVYQDTGIPFIRSQNVTGNKLVLDKTHISETINNKMKGSIVMPNDILLNITGGSIGRTCVVPEDFVIGNVNQHVCIIRLKEKYNPKFLQPFISSHNGQKLIYQGQTGSGREGLNFQSIRLFKFNLPPLPEQQKIASFLSAVDEKIQQLTKKKALLEQYKKGVMQQLFSSQLRFKDEEGKDYADWEEKRLIDITKINQGLQIAISERYLEPVEDGYFYITNEFLRAKSEKAYYIKSPPESVICFEEDILMTRTGNTGQVVTGVHGAFHNNFFKIKYEGYCEKWFLYYFLTARKTQHTILKLAGTSTIPDLNHGDFYKIKIDLPSIKEQSKISDVVKSIDTKIESVSNQISKTQRFKKGLLQQMFV